jgi:pyruvate formate lyase activating enzyme
MKRRRGPAADAPPALRIGGLTPLSATDYPGALAAVVFCQGCPWRCGYCHNPHLLSRCGGHELAWPAVLDFLERRRGLLDAVVYSGGEPTVQGALPDAMRATRALGFKVGLHTAGMAPRRLAAVLPLADWVGMDIKAPFDDYPRITGVRGSGHAARKSARLILASGVAHEFRTTVHPALLREPELQRLASELAGLGARHYVLQAFRAQGCAATAFAAGHAGTDLLGPALRGRLSELFCSFSIRPA